MARIGAHETPDEAEAREFPHGRRGQVGFGHAR
jgi:hypothetical protein